MRTRLRALLGGALALALLAPATAANAGQGDRGGGERDTLLRYAADTWTSMAAMTDDDTGSSPTTSTAR